jgi:hypothetical protein
VKLKRKETETCQMRNNKKAVSIQWENILIKNVKRVQKTKEGDKGFARKCT